MSLYEVYDEDDKLTKIKASNKDGKIFVSRVKKYEFKNGRISKIDKTKHSKKHTKFGKFYDRFGFALWVSGITIIVLSISLIISLYGSNIWS